MSLVETVKHLAGWRGQVEQATASITSGTAELRNTIKAKRAESPVGAPSSPPGARRSVEVWCERCTPGLSVLEEGLCVQSKCGRRFSYSPFYYEAMGQTTPRHCDEHRERSGFRSARGAMFLVSDIKRTTSGEVERPKGAEGGVSVIF